MQLILPPRPLGRLLLIAALSLQTLTSAAADKALLDILLSNGVITAAQYDSLMKRERLTSEDILGTAAAPRAPAAAPAAPPASVGNGDDGEVVAETGAVAAPGQPLDPAAEQRIVARVARRLEEEFPVKASYGAQGFRLETRDGNWQTNLQWRGQFRFTTPFVGDPRQLATFESGGRDTIEARRLRMKIGGHGYQPWLKYYFEVDLEPSREVDDDSAESSARVIDWRVDLARFPWAQLRVGQWKIDLNRERVDSSGRQQFVERSIVNRIFTIDRQVGIQLRGHLFRDTPADLRYWAGVFTGEGRGVVNDDESMMKMARLQWNFLGRDLDWRQTDVEYTELPTGSLAFAAASNEGRCTRWSSGGCGNLDGFTAPADAFNGEFEIEQMVQEFAFKWRGFSAQQEYHWKTVDDRLDGTSYDFQGAYAQVGYFFHHLFPIVPAPLELAFRYAFVDEPNRFDRALDNHREEFTLGANWFFAGHDNKLTLDASHLTLDEALLASDVSENRLRLQWDVSF